MKYAITLTSIRQLVVDVPPGQPPFVIEDGVMKFKEGEKLHFATPATNLVSCDLMPDESPIVLPS